MAIARDQVPADVDPAITNLPTSLKSLRRSNRAFGKPVAASAPEQLAEINRVRKIVSKSLGMLNTANSYFVKQCANCHQLFGEGKKVGPPLDGYQRGDQSFWLNAIIVPSLEIREGFQSYLVLTDGGRAINGMIAAQDDATVTLRNADNQLTVLDRDQIES